MIWGLVLLALLGPSLSDGAHDRLGTTPVQRTFRLRQLIKHEGFIPSQLKNDIALLQLQGSVSTSSKVHTVCLPQKGTQAQIGKGCYITGWGRTIGGGSLASTLQQALLPVASHKACSSVNGKIIPVDERSMICAGGKGHKGGCQGDSGGPFVCNEGGKWVLRGAVSWGHSMCKTNHYSVFARISNFVDWIKGKISACGVKPFSARVVNGQNAAKHAWPWQISLRVNGRHICGGSLIKPDWVITAAHCVARNPSPSGYTVVVGAHYRLGTTPVQRTFRLRQLFKHEGFSMRHLRNDIALLQLQGSVSTSSKVNTVCLPQKGSQAQISKGCYITGWGRTIGGGSAASTLQQAMLPVASHQACSRVNGQLVAVDQRSMICAGGRGRGGCQGDSGGPFVCNEGGKWVLRGAVSWGHSMCRTDHYTVFARISNFVDWINGKMSGKIISC
ncbi:hypothetical protein QZH41_008298 [Actinostola sp. cb2023]|nr:hypothetical protein QZH41_008298 [Actinostola sp. cb2023]